MTIGFAACSDIAVHGKTSKPHTEECRNRIGEQMEHDPDGHERLQIHKRRRDVDSEIEANGAPFARENEGDPAPQERQDVQMPVEAPFEPASVQRGSDAVVDNEDRARFRLGAEGKRGQKHDIQDVLKPQAKTRVRPEPRRGQKRESTQPLTDLQEEVTSTVPVESGAAPIQGSWSADVPVDSSVGTSVSVEDTVQTSVPISTSVGIQPASSGTVGSLCFNESKTQDVEKLTNLVLTSKAFPGSPSRESVKGLVKTCLEMCAADLTEVYSPALFNERSMQLGLSTGGGCRT